MGLLDNSAANSQPAKLPALPEVPRGVDRAMYQLLEAIKERLEVREGSRGNKFEKVVTERRLVEFLKGDEFKTFVVNKLPAVTPIYQQRPSTVSPVPVDKNPRVDGLVASLRDELLKQIDLIRGSTVESIGRKVAEEATNRVQEVSREAQIRLNDITLEARERADAVAANAQAILENALAIDGQRDYTNLTVATATTSLTTTINEGIAAEAAQRTTLAAQLRGGYTGNDLTQVTSGLFYQEAFTRASAINALSQQITLLSAGAGEQFDWATIWYFDAGTEGWTGNGTPTVSGGWVRPANSTSPSLTSPEIAIDGNKYIQVRLRVRKHGSPVWTGTYVWSGGTGTATEPTYDANGVGLVTINAPWTGTVEYIGISLYDDQTATDWHEVDWVAIGRPSPGASSAQLYEEQVVRAAADASMAADILLLTADVGANNALISDEATTRATNDTAIAATVTALTATVTNNKTTTDAALAAESSARTSGDSAEATQRQTLSTKLTGLADPTSATLASLTSGLIFDERTTRSTADSTIAASVSLLEANTNTALGNLNAAILNEAEARTTDTEATAKEIKRITSSSAVDAEGILRNAIGTDNEIQARTQSIAVIEQTFETRVEEGLLAEANARLVLAGVVNDNQAQLVNNYYTKATTDSAISEATTELKSEMEGPAGSVGSLAATLTNDYYTKVSVDGALTSLTTQLQAYADGVGEDSAALITTLEQTKIGYAIKGGRAFDNGGLIKDKAGVDAWNAANPGDVATWVVGLPLATAVKQVSVTDGTGAIASVEQAFTAQKTLNDGLLGQYAVKVNAGGKVAGFGLSSTSPVAGSGTSAFVIVADKFSISAGATDYAPFAVDAANGKVYITGDLNVDGAITIRGTAVTIGNVKDWAQTAYDSIYTATELENDLASGAASIISGALDGTARMELDPAGQYVVFKHKDAVVNGSTGAYSGATVRTGLGLTAGGVIAGYNRQSDGAWQNSFVLDSATGDVTILGTLKAGSVIETGATIGVGGSTIGAVATNAANAASGLSAKLNKSGSDILSGDITFTSAGGFKTDGISIGSGGATSGTGIAMTSAGIVGRNAGGITFAIDTNGNATFKGDITGATGTFAGALSTANNVYATGGNVGTLTGQTEYGTIVGMNTGHAYPAVAGHIQAESPASLKGAVEGKAYNGNCHGVVGYSQNNVGVVGEGPTGVACLGSFRFGSYTYAQPNGSSSTFLRADGNWAAPSVDWSAVTSKPSTFPPAVHGHFLSDIQPSNFDTPSFQFSTDGGATWTAILLKRL